MGIGLNSVHLLSKPLRALGGLGDKRLLTLGVQDCAFTHEQLVRFLEKHRIPHAPLPAGEIELNDGFKWLPAAERARYRECIHQRTLFRVLGFRAENIRSMDYSAFEGADIVHDLNAPVDAALHAKFDLIYDGGTLEHVFSTRDCLFNISRMCRVSGIAVNVSPADSINHGFVNVNACLLGDFFRANGYEEIALKYVAFPSHAALERQHYLEYRPEDLHHSLNPFYSTNVFSAFRKLRETDLRVPNQSYYVNLWADEQAAGGSGNGQPRSALNRLRRRLVSVIDGHFALAVLVRGYRMILRGKRVSL